MNKTDKDTFTKLCCDAIAREYKRSYLSKECISEAWKAEGWQNRCLDIIVKIIEDTGNEDEVLSYYKASKDPILRFENLHRCAGHIFKEINDTFQKHGDISKYITIIERPD